MIDLENVSKTYSAGAPAVNDINLHIEEGEFVFIVGNSGAGKSTLIKLMLKELEPTTGRIIINGKDLKKIKHRKIHLLRRDIGVVFQDFRLLKDRSVYDNVAFAQRVVEVPNRVIRRKVPAMLSMVGLAEKYKSFPRELSGGEQQRVALARALVNNPPILLADEPTGALDSVSGRQIMELFSELNQEGMTVLMITHDAQIAGCADRMVMIKDGRLKDGEEQENGKE